MSPTEARLEDKSHAEDAPDYTRRSRRDHATTAGDPSRISTGSLRHLHFGATGAWGFIAGAAGILAALAFEGKDVRPEGRGIWVLIPAMLVAIAGSAVIAGAYQEAKRRRRG